MDITFWVIQGLLLTPVLVLAASVGLEERPGRSRYAPLDSDRRAVAVAATGLTQFTAEQHARLVALRGLVQDARKGRGALRDDVPPPPPTSTGHHRRSTGRQLVLAGAVLAMVFGLAGVVRTNAQMNLLQENSYSRGEPLSPAERFLPGVIVSPGKYLSAVNGGASAANAAGDPLYAFSVMELKQAMDRWEALAGIGLGLLLFLNATRAPNEETSVGADVAPFVLVAAFLFAALSLFELP